MDVRSAELTKYAANAMLATRISFMNELANLADALGADIEHVRQGIGSDPRIGYHFLYPGVGYGGSCFPKDVKALQHDRARSTGAPLRVLAAVEAVNDAQKLRLVEKIVARLGDDLAGRTLRAVGARVQAQYRRHARGAVARDHRGACSRAARRVVAYDPVAIDEAQRASSATLPASRFAASPMAALARRRRAVVVTEWKEFRSPDFGAIRSARCKQPLRVRRPQPVRPGAGARRRARVFRRSAAADVAIDLRQRAPVSPSSASASRAPRVLVVGDVMLDRYWFGDVERISPEAPVPVVKIARTEERPGGAANVARNAAALGAQVTLFRRHRRRRAGRVAGAAARRRARAHVAASRRVAADDGQAARDRPPAAAAAHRFRDARRRTKCSPPSSPTTSALLADIRRRRPVRLRQGRPRAHRAHDRARARRRQAGAGRSQGRGLRALSRRDAAHAQPRRIPRRSSGRWRNEAELADEGADRCARELGLDALLVTRSEEGMTLYTDCRRAAHSRRRRAKSSTSPAPATR